MPKTQKLVTDLAKTGPHRVVRGDLALAGLPGVIYAPKEGTSLPAVAFAHGWMSSSKNYDSTLKHLASWGFVVAAPNTQRGPVPSHAALAHDLTVALDICAGIRLGTGDISVHPDKLAVVGHAMGAGAAVLAASQRSDIRAVAALYPAPTSPRVLTDGIADAVTAPALVIGAPTELNSLTAEPVALAGALGGPTVLRVIDKSVGDGIVEGRKLASFFGVGNAQPKTRKIVRALLTGFLLHRLARHEDYEAFSDPEVEFKGTRVLDPNEPTADVPVKGGALRQLSHLAGR
ncbi:dienelactone hydrolase family protein [Rhodococcoides kroppenstedtii]|uniref:dienelactone hydrolase family protein n=1 Tax=Rhodococcoides kroppenstedtii TaxID=293050 RepID=UPI0036320373